MTQDIIHVRANRVFETWFPSYDKFLQVLVLRQIRRWPWILQINDKDGWNQEAGLSLWIVILWRLRQRIKRMKRAEMKRLLTVTFRNRMLDVLRNQRRWSERHVSISYTEEVFDGEQISSDLIGGADEEESVSQVGATCQASQRTVAGLMELLEGPLMSGRHKRIFESFVSGDLIGWKSKREVRTQLRMGGEEFNVALSEVKSFVRRVL